MKMKSATCQAELKQNAADFVEPEVKAAFNHLIAAIVKVVLDAHSVILTNPMGGYLVPRYK